MLVSENRPEWLIADLGIMAAGCVTVPTYTTNTTRDHQHILANSGASAVIVSTQKLAKNAAAGGAVRIRMPPRHFDRRHHHRPVARCRAVPPLGRNWCRAASDIGALEQRMAGVKRDDLACIIYTSGTGGAPRGVMQHHGMILHNVEGCIDVIANDFGWDDEVFLSFLPASHAYEHSGGQHFPIALGAQIYYAESLEKLAANIEEVRPTIMVVVPRLFEMLRAKIMKQVEKDGGLPAYLMSRAMTIETKRYAGKSVPWDLPMDGLLSLTLRRKVRRKFGGRMKAMVSGGAPLNPDVGLFFQAMGLPMLQGYGQTEAGPVISCNRPKAGIRMETVGPPLTNTEVRIANDGEIMVRGELVMKGYWHNDDESARVLQDGWLATGDVGHLDEQEPDRHHRPQEGPDRQRQGRQCLAAAGRGDADASARNPAGDGLWRPPAAPGGAAGPRCRRDEAVQGRSGGHAEGAVEGGRPGQCRASVIEKVRRFILADEPFSVENEMLTPSMKIRRHVIGRGLWRAADALFKR